MAQRQLGALASAANHVPVKSQTDPLGGMIVQTIGTVDTGRNGMKFPYKFRVATRITRLEYWIDEAGSGGTLTAALRTVGTGGSDISGSSGTPAIGGGTALTGLSLDFAARDVLWVICTSTNSTLKPVGLACYWEGYAL